MKNSEKPEPVFDGTTGLIPAIAQDYSTGEILMMAWMNRDAWDATLREGIAIYWSRSRNRLWRKGERSGNIQRVRDIFLDCDRDTVLLKVQQVGNAACHTGRRSCFFTRLTETGSEITSEPLFNPEEVYKD